jgi:magnesium chelatase family protein
MFLEVPKVKTSKFNSKEDSSESESSEVIQKRVQASRKIQLDRFHGTKLTFNAEMSSEEIKKFCILDTDCDLLLRQAVDRLKLSARSYFRILKLSRTIADLE